MVTSLVAVFGTLAGVALTFYGQDRLERRSRRAQIDDMRRTERREACTALGAALVKYRHGQYARKTHRLIHREDSEPLREEVRQARGEAWAAFFRVELLTDDERMRTAAEHCMESIRQLKYAANHEALDLDATKARNEIRGLMELARERLLTAQTFDQ